MVPRRSATAATIRLSKRLMQPSVHCGKSDSRFFPATGLPYPKRRGLSFGLRAYQIPSWPMRTSRGKSLDRGLFPQSISASSNKAPGFSSPSPSSSSVDLKPEDREIDAAMASLGDARSSPPPRRRRILHLISITARLCLNRFTLSQAMVRSLEANAWGEIEGRRISSLAAPTAPGTPRSDIPSREPKQGSLSAKLRFLRTSGFLLAQV